MSDQPAPAAAKACPQCGSEDENRVGPLCRIAPGPFHKEYLAWRDDYRAAQGRPLPVRSFRKANRNRQRQS